MVIFHARAGKDEGEAPANKEEWAGVTKQMWNFQIANISRVIKATAQLTQYTGAIDGRHIVIQAPVKSGSSSFNCKGTHSVVLLAVCDAHYCFTLATIGHHSDGVEFDQLSLAEHLKREHSVPSHRPLPGTTQPNLPYV